MSAFKRNLDLDLVVNTKSLQLNAFNQNNKLKLALVSDRHTFVRRSLGKHPLWNKYIQGPGTFQTSL